MVVNVSLEEETQYPKRLQDTPAPEMHRKTPMSLPHRVAHRYLIRQGQSAPDEKVLKWMKARAKKGKGAFVPDMVEDAFNHLKGWDLEGAMGYKSLKGYSGGDVLPNLKGMADPLAHGVLFGSRGSKPPATFTSRDRGEKGKKNLEAWLKRMTSAGKVVSGKKPPGKADPQRLYFTKPSEIRLEDRGGRWEFQVDHIWAGVPGWEVKAPNGKKKIVLHPTGHNNFLMPTPGNLASFWTFVYKNGLDADAQAFLDTQDRQLVEDLSKSKVDREKAQALREYSPEVKKVLQKITDTKYRDVVEYWSDALTRIVQEFLSAQAKANKDGKPLEIYSWTRKNPRYAAHYSLLQKVFSEREYQEIGGQHVSVLKPKDAAKLIKERATRIADTGRDGFIEKNTIKLSAIANRKGNLKKAEVLSLNPEDYDYGGEILFTFMDGSSFIVRNKTVWKRSVNGAVFAQYPTTFHKVKMPDGKAMKSPSEKRMVDVFAVA